MAVSGDVTIAQDGGNARLHPYLVALVRWCVSCLWSTATVLLHRLMTAPLQPVAASKWPKSRPAGKDHLDPEPRVECVVLHQPSVHNLDVIFVHGLYGSLCNTWRQGEWGTKYENNPDKIHLRGPPPPLPNKCYKCTDIPSNSEENYFNDDILDENDFNDKKINNDKNDFNNSYIDDKGFNDYENINNAFTNIDEKFYKNIKKILPKEDVFITEKFYNNSLLNHVEIVGNYETQAKFVSDLFKNNCDSDCDSKNMNDEQSLFKNEQNLFNDNDMFKNTENMCNEAGNMYNDDGNVNKDNENTCKCNNEGENEINISLNDCKCKTNDDKQCEVGCGCVCDECYSPCWPKDWIRVDYPDARVISINYTSDPHLWRPLWVKENKRLRLHERAEQMTQQLLDLGVGDRPVIWVGHSKGGLFIKQIYCEAYDAYMKIKSNTEKPNELTQEQNMTEFNKDNEINNFNDCINSNNDNIKTNNDCININNDVIIAENSNNNKGNRSNENDFHEDEIVVKANNVSRISVTITENTTKGRHENENSIEMKNEEKILRNKYQNGSQLESSNRNEDTRTQKARAAIWSNSLGFMFYSVPHRGSPLADIKTPLTARSPELIEITKDCSLLLSLQERWLTASCPSQPLVRSLVETRRTLMSVLWLRIVAAESADPGIGTLWGVSVDHREICKPSSRRCLLYTELTTLIRAAISKCRCQY